ncbi:hypothetical protein HNQ36_003050 [Afipia massiliensis]|uniref:Uncharacterized protein n=1 Tax=Afipia massiliensis TaxID=211460 RepID=A0A840MXQ1_9BRAD|nr:hypothetical protein [Afipia massiliensis]MBB5053059.1 hypothetical protein [Afipia massiliensis]
MFTQDSNTIERPATTSDLKVFGLHLGVQCAQSILESDCNDSLTREVIIAKFHNAIESYLAVQKGSNGLTATGERGYRLGFSRGLTSQLLHPKARIDIKVEKASA